MALALGCTVEELLERMTAAEFAEWQAYYSIEPWGAWRDNWHAAMMLAMTYNMNRGKQPAKQIRDFMYEDAESVARRSAKTLKAKLDAMARQNG